MPQKIRLAAGETVIICDNMTSTERSTRIGTIPYSTGMRLSEIGSTASSDTISVGDELRQFKLSELPLSHYAHRYEKYGIYDYRSKNTVIICLLLFVFTVRADIMSVCLGAFPL